MKPDLSLSQRAAQLVRSTSRSVSHDRKRMVKEWRPAACDLLAFNQIPSAVWFDDVLEFHGGEPAKSELYLVVDSPFRAARALVQNGHYRIYRPKSDVPLRAGPLEKNDIYLKSQGRGTNVVLLSAREWHFDLRPDELHDFRCPWMPRFIDSLMRYWLSVPPEEYESREKTMNFIAYMVVKCYQLNDLGEVIANNKYGRHLHFAHLELHFDIVSCQRGPTGRPFDYQKRHMHHVRKYNQIKAGIFVPRPCRKDRYHPALPPLLELVAEEG